VKSRQIEWLVFACAVTAFTLALANLGREAAVFMVLVVVLTLWKHGRKARETGNYSFSEIAKTSTDAGTVLEAAPASAPITYSEGKKIYDQDQEHLKQFFLQHAPVLWNDRYTCRCGHWATNRDSDEIVRAKSWAEHMIEELLPYMERILCAQCGKSVSTPVPKRTIVRAWVECPECINRRGEIGP